MGGTGALFFISKKYIRLQLAQKQFNEKARLSDVVGKESIRSP
jgi:hypothetical protein